MHILITGGQGYIGGYLTRYFLQKGYFVTTLDTNFNSKPLDLTQYDVSKLRRFNESVINADVVYRALDGVNVVYHLAARTDFDNSYRHPFRLCHTNVEGTTNLLCMCNRAGIDRVIFTSTAAVYGNLVGAKETDPCIPVNMYGATKLAAEAICKGFYQRGMDIIIFRFYNVWGWLNSESVVNKFSNGCKTIIGDGQQTRDFVFIEDVLSALNLGLDLEPGTYNVGTEEEFSINALFEKLNPGINPEYKPFKPGYDEPIRSCSDISTISQFGWKPNVTLSNLSREEIKQLCESS